MKTIADFKEPVMEDSKGDNESFIPKEKILQALSALRQLNENFSESAKKKPLLEDLTESPIYLQVTLKKIPLKRSQKFIKVRLPKSCLTNKAEVCLITGDLDKKNTKAEYDSDILYYKDLLRKENINSVSEVMTLRQLRTEYKPYEARRQLVGAYDVFLCDKKIAGVLPSTLGKNFFRKRKLPLQINMSTPFLKKQIDNALSTISFQITCRGNTVNSEVANFAMSDADIVKNVIAVTDALKDGLPGEWNNVSGLYIKAARSKAIPIYLSFDDTTWVKFEPIKRQRPVTGELSTLPEATVKVSKDGRISVKKLKLDEDGLVVSTEKKVGGTDKIKSKAETSLKKSKKLKRKNKTKSIKNGKDGRNPMKKIKLDEDGIVLDTEKEVGNTKNIKAKSKNPFKKSKKLKLKHKIKSNKKTKSK